MSIPELQRLIEAFPAFDADLLIGGRPAGEVLAKEIHKAQAKGKAAKGRKG